MDKSRTLLTAFIAAGIVMAGCAGSVAESSGSATPVPTAAITVTPAPTAVPTVTPATPVTTPVASRVSPRPSLLPSEVAAAHIAKSVKRLENLGTKDGQGLFDWLYAEGEWLKSQPDIIILTEYRYIVNDRLEEITKSESVTVGRIAEIVQAVVDAADQVPGVDLQ